MVHATDWKEGELVKCEKKAMRPTRDILGFGDEDSQMEMTCDLSSVIDHRQHYDEILGEYWPNVEYKGKGGSRK